MNAHNAQRHRELIRRHVADLRKRQGITLKDLAHRMGMRDHTTLVHRLSEGAFPIDFLHALAEALCVSPYEILTGCANPGEVIWNPLGDEAKTLRAILEPHEAKAKTGMGLFRIPNCAVLGKDLLKRINRNLFVGYGELIGERLMHAYDTVGMGYMEDFERREGNYAGLELTTLIFDCDLERMPLGGHPYEGCRELAMGFFDRLRKEYIPQLNYRLRIIDASRVPSGVMYELAGVESIILVGHTMSVRRQFGNFRLSGADGGAALADDIRILKELESVAGEFDPQRTISKLERLMRSTEKNRSKDEHGGDDEKPGNLWFPGNWP
jgi:transcriptional regulator with XRE-family HTH domain